MSFPNYTDKFQGKSIMKPEDTIDMRRQFGRFPTIDPPKGLVLCLKNDLPYQLRWKTPVQKVGRVMGGSRTRSRIRRELPILATQPADGSGRSSAACA